MVSLQTKPKFLKPEDNPDSLDVLEENTFVFNTNHNLGLTEQRERLPIRKYRDQILYCLENYQTTIIVGETGSGKSTQIPQYLYELGWHLKGIIGVTEPRRISAMTLTERVAQERGELVGGVVGLSIRFMEKTSESTKIKFMTEGILLREMLADPLMTQYSVLIIDEAHERSLLSDIVLGLLKKIIKKRSTLKLVISSATIDAQFFKEFFDIQKKDAKKQETSIILSVEGRMHPVNIFYKTEPCADYVKESVESVMKIHRTEPPGGILVFLTGQEEVLECLDLLNEYKISENLENLQLMPLYSTLTGKDQLKAFFTPPKGTRKVVLATNIAETSVTIPGISYVVDCGFAKMKWFNPETLSDSLVVLPVSKAAAIQRAGRAGRVRPGKVYRLYTEKDYLSLPDRIPPEMRRSELSGVLLHLKALGINNILRFDFLSPPPAKNVLAALSTLSALEAIDQEGNLTKPIGYFLAEMPFEPMLSKMLHVSTQQGCSEEIISIIAMMQVQNVFSKPASAQAQAKGKIAKRRFEVAEGDLITLLNVYTAFIENGQTREFCGKHFLIYRNLKRAHEIREQLATMLKKKFGISLVSCNGNVEIICKCITAGFILNVAFLHHSGVYRKIQSNVELYVHPQSLLYTLPQPQYVVYCELLQTTKLFMNYLTVIKGDFLTELAPQCYYKAKYEEI